MWRLANRIVLWIGPAIPAIATTLFSLASGAADNSDEAKIWLRGMSRLVSAWITEPVIWLLTALFVAGWAALFFFTDHRARKEEKAVEGLETLAKRMKDAADGVTRLTVLWRERSDGIAPFDPEERERYIERSMQLSRYLMADYTILYGAHVLALIEEAKARGIAVEQDLSFLAAHGNNPLTVEDVARRLSVLADRIRIGW